MIALLVCLMMSKENVLGLTNMDRQQRNIPALVENIDLDNAAQDKASDMYSRKYFSHTAPDGKTPWKFMVEEGYFYLRAGENLATNFIDPIKQEEAWMDSPGHKANILNPKFRDVGIGIQGHVVVVMFGSK